MVVPIFNFPTICNVNFGIQPALLPLGSLSLGSRISGTERSVFLFCRRSEMLNIIVSLIAILYAVEVFTHLQRLINIYLWVIWFFFFRCVVAYASDLIFLQVSLNPHREKGLKSSSVSLDHS